MKETLDISKINRKKLGSQLPYGAHKTIHKRLEKKGIKAGYRIIGYAYNPKYPLTGTIKKVLKETLAYLEDLRKDKEVKVHKDIADALQ